MATILANPREPSSSQPESRELEIGKPPLWRLPAALRYWHLASLDAPTVAVVWGWCFAWTAHGKVAVWPLALLGLVVWAIYIGDRLLDARAGLGKSQPGIAREELRERHYFHWRHRRVLAPLAAASALAAMCIARLRVPEVALPQDSAVAAATLAYFSGVHGRFRLPAALGRLLAAMGSRECLVGALFAAGCVLPAWSMAPASDGPAARMTILALPAVYFAVLAWLNVRAITDWESAEPGRVRLGRMAWTVAAAGLALSGWLLPVQPRAAAMVAAGSISAALIGLLDWRRAHIGPLTLRVAVDLALLAPLFLAAAERLAR